MTPLQGFDPISIDDAVALLAAESKMDAPRGELAEIAAMLDAEPPVLRWAASLAKTTGWGPLRTRILNWSSFARAPWHDEVERVLHSLEAPDAELLTRLAGCDAPFAWDVLEAVVPNVSIESVGRLEEMRLLRRLTSAGVVTFVASYAVRASLRAATKLASEPWLAAWVERAKHLRAASYGPNARATLTELGAAIPLAARALFVEKAHADALALWLASSDAAFFGDAITFDSPAFAHAVVVADALGKIAPRVHARLVAGRAALERSDPTAAAALTKEALALADHDELRAEALRGAGWAALALTHLDEAKSAFAEARALCEGEPRGQADATAGLGILALLSGEPNTARALFEEAVAIHVVMRDAPREGAVRGMMALLPEGAADASQLVGQVDDLRAKGQRWREALVLARLALDARTRGDGATERARLFEARAAASLSNMPASKLVRSMIEAREESKPFVVGVDGRTLTVPGAAAQDLSRHGPVRRILWALAIARRDHPGTAMSTLAMIDAGWPGEQMQHEAATLRVYTTIRRLRSLGLGAALVTRDDGYLIDPETTLSFA